MADLIFYTNPQSRGQIVRWMLEEVGQPYETEIDPVRPDEGGALPGDQPDGEGPGDQAQRPGRHRGRGDLRLSRRRLPRGRPWAARRREGRLLPLDLLCVGPGRSAVSNQAMGWTPTPERERMFGYGNYDQAIAVLEELFSAARLCLRRPLHRGRRLSSARRSCSRCSSGCCPSATASPATAIGCRPARPIARAGQIDDEAHRAQAQAAQPQPA